MTGHELLPDQTATPPSRPADNLAPVACRIAITGLLHDICHRTLCLNGFSITPHAQDLAYPLSPDDGLRTCQIQKNP
jgi:hypothetical protein